MPKFTVSNIISNSLIINELYRKCVLLTGGLEVSFGIFLLTVPRRYFFCGSNVFCMSCICHDFASVHGYLGCLVVTCWERADLLALVCDVSVFRLRCGT